MGNYKGCLTGVPDKVVNLMLKRQVEQGNPADVNVFEKCLDADKEMGGFDWDKTEEKFETWYDILAEGKHYLVPDEPPKEAVSCDTHAIDTWTKRR